MKLRSYVLCVFLLATAMAAPARAVDVTVRLVDQYGADLERGHLFIAGWFVASGSTVSIAAGTHAVTLFPLAQGHLTRPAIAVVDAATTELRFEWIVAHDVRLRGVDQFGAELTNTTIFSVPPNGFVPNGSLVDFPIIDPTEYPDVSGPYASGYFFRLAPIGQVSNLERSLQGPIIREATTQIDFEWIIASCPLEVLDDHLAPVPGSTLVLPTNFEPWAPGVPVPLRVTDDATYPDAIGDFSDGYPVQVIPGDIAPTSTTLVFDVPPSGELSPASFAIGGRTYSVACVLCGNAQVDPLEECDDGNDLAGDGCRADCTEELCGDAVLDPGEQCDDGNLTSGDGCQSNCALPVCGDGFGDPGEECDDGNLAGGDGCSDTCHAEVCGNATVDPGEQCDDGNAGAGDGCRPDCTQELCGDGLLDPQEVCDDANNTPGDGCRADCSAELCGDGVVDPQEQCDDGNVTSGDGCQVACVLPLCGDDVLDAGEQCDDGNTGAGDGCSATCALEICGNGILDPAEQCDDGNTSPADGCRANCTIEVCGDAILDPQEQCDDGNVVAGDGCSASCVIEDVSGGEGCRPRFWRTHLGDWPAAYAPSTPFASVFENAFPGMTLAQVLRQRGGGVKALGRQTVAALLNAASPEVSYDLSPAEVVSMFNDTYPGSKRAYNTLRANFRRLNRQGCPLVPPHDDWCEDDDEDDD